MLNPNEIVNTKFDKYMGKGYRQDDVDNFLRQVASDMASLMEEKHDLERKMNILADKLEEYKSDEDSLRSALIGAQKLGDTVIRDAKEKASRILEEAQSEARRASHDAKSAIERERNSFIRLQQEVSNFKNKLQITYKQHLELISSLPTDETSTQARTAQPQAVVEQRQPPQQQSQEQPEEDVVSYEQEPIRQEMPSVSSRERGREYETMSYRDAEPPTLSYRSEEQVAAEAATREITIAYDDDLPLTDERDLLPRDGINDMMPADGYDYETAVPIEPDHKLGRYESRFGPLKFGSEYNIKREDDKRKK